MNYVHVVAEKNIRDVVEINNKIKGEKICYTQ